MTDYRRFLPLHNDRMAYRTARRALILRYYRGDTDVIRLHEAELYGFCLGWYNHTHYSHSTVLDTLQPDNFDI